MAVPVEAYPVVGQDAMAATYPAAAPLVVAQPIQQQPVVVQATLVGPPLHYANQWHRNLFDGVSEPGICLLGWCCPCVLFGMNEQRLDPAANGIVQGGLFFCMAAVAGAFSIPYCW